MWIHPLRNNLFLFISSLGGALHAMCSLWELQTSYCLSELGPRDLVLPIRTVNYYLVIMKHTVIICARFDLIPLSLFSSVLFFPSLCIVTVQITIWSKMTCLRSVWTRQKGNPNCTEHTRDWTATPPSCPVEDTYKPHSAVLVVLTMLFKIIALLELFGA